MRIVAVALLAGIGAVAATGGAKAADIYTSGEYVDPALVQQVRTVCNEDGRCYRVHRGSRVIVRDSYNYAPRDRYYYERRSYRHWDEPSAGVGIHAPGVSVGIGSNRW